MKKYIVIALFVTAFIGVITMCSKSASAEEQPSVITHPEYDEETMQVCAHNIWDLFDQLQHCPAMMEEVIQNPLLRECYLCASHNDCIDCAALLMFKLWQESDVWADTLGESEAGDYMPEDVVYLLHERTLHDEQMLKKYENI